jgi:hypothetical protein
MQTPAPTAAREWRDVTAATFRDQIMPEGQPAVLRGLVRDWPAVRAGIESPLAISNYIRGHDSGTACDTMYGDPAIRGHFFYNDELTGINFERRPAPLAQSLQQLLDLIENPSPPAIYAGAVPTPSSLPGFSRENSLPLIDPTIVPRIWISNRVTVPAHYDLSSNIACVVAGRRRFTMFPPEQLLNLYVGPLEFTLAGQPISMVHLDRPDFERYPKFRGARSGARCSITTCSRPAAIRSRICRRASAESRARLLRSSRTWSANISCSCCPAGADPRSPREREAPYAHALPV